MIFSIIRIRSDSFIDAHNRLKQYFQAKGNRLFSWHRFIQIVTMLCWMMLMTCSNSYYIIYLIIGLFGFYSRRVVSRYRNRSVFISERVNLSLAVFFSILLIAANYDMFDVMMDSLYHSLSKHNHFVSTFSSFSDFLHYKYAVILFCLPVLFFGGLFLFFFILQFVTDKLTYFSWEKEKESVLCSRVFLTVLLTTGIFYSLILILCFYPGFFCPDTITQLSEILSDNYSNRNPFYHTMLVRCFIKFGIDVLGNINLGAALYSLFSVFFLSSSFAYAIVTLYQLRINKKIIYAAAIFYMVMPHNILFSFNMWKDTPFNAFVLLFTVSVFRYLNQIGTMKLNYVILPVSCLGVCLFRGNGLIVVFVTVIMVAALFRKKEPRMLISLASVLAFALLMTYPLLNQLGVTQSDIVELSSMPIQQIARTLKDHDDLSLDDLELIAKVADIDTVKEIYDPTLSDPLKVHLRSKESQQYIEQHKSEFGRLYIKLGLKYPVSYMAAWIDQTRGYWNGGYDCVKFCYAFMDNSYGLEKHIILDKGQKAVFLYCTLYEIVDPLKPFVSIGLHTWLILLVVFIGYRKRDKSIILTAVPSLAIVFSLLLGTPVFCEFRYAYGLFCCLPFLAVAAFSKSTNEPQSI